MVLIENKYLRTLTVYCLKLFEIQEIQEIFSETGFNLDANLL